MPVFHGYDLLGEPILESTLMECALDLVNPDADLCICRGSGKVVSDDDQATECRYHFPAYQPCRDCGRQIGEEPQHCKNSAHVGWHEEGCFEFWG